MNNFGVIEVASTKTTNAPGWAYVPDTGASSGPSQSVSAVHLHVNRNKRAARQANNAAGAGAGATGSAAQHLNDLSARHDAKLQKEIDQLQRDSAAGAPIPVPSGGRDRDGKVRGHTPNVRKILVSQKTFANHLDDFEAWKRTGEGAAAAGGGVTNHSSATGTPVPPAAAAAVVAAAGGAGRMAVAGGAAAQKKKKSGASATPKRSHKKKAAAPTPAPAPAVNVDADVAMPDAPTAAAAEEEEEEEAQHKAPAETESKLLRPFAHATAAPPPHAQDNNPLLASWLPPLPTDQELRALITAPPLDFHQARGAWGDEDGRLPPRSFCEVCGYWGRVRCMKCGTRVCALDCLDVHREECITRYGL